MISLNLFYSFVRHKRAYFWVCLLPLEQFSSPLLLEAVSSCSLNIYAVSLFKATDFFIKDEYNDPT